MKLVKNNVTFENRDGEYYVVKVGYIRLATPVHIVGLHNIAPTSVVRCCSENGATNDFVIWIDDETRYVFHTFAEGNYVAVRVMDLSNSIKKYQLLNRYVSKWNVNS